MIPCECGNSMHRHRNYFLQNGTERQTFRCKSCKREVSFYRKDKGQWEMQRDEYENEFMEAIARARNEARAVDSGEIQHAERIQVRLVA